VFLRAECGGIGSGGLHWMSFDGGEFAVGKWDVLIMPCFCCCIAKAIVNLISRFVCRYLCNAPNPENSNVAFCYRAGKVSTRTVAIQVKAPDERIV
jgi:hypothetical protein